MDGIADFEEWFLGLVLLVKKCTDMMAQGRMES